MLKKAKAETCGFSKVKVSEFEEDCSLVNTDPTGGLSGRQVVVQHDGFGWRSLQKSLVCFWKMFAWENTHREQHPCCSPFSSSLFSHFPSPSAEPCRWTSAYFHLILQFFRLDQRLCAQAVLRASDRVFEHMISSTFIADGFLLRLKSQGGAACEKSKYHG